MKYNDKISPDKQIATEEMISSIIFDSGEMLLNDDGVDEEVCSYLSRDILLKVLAEFRPDLIDIEPDPSLWPPECQQMAQMQGWDIFDADGSEDGRWQIQAIAAPGDHPHLDYIEPKFKDENGHVSDRAAAEFVQRQADAGDELAQRAIKFLITVNSKDVNKFGLHTPSEAK